MTQVPHAAPAGYDRLVRVAGWSAEGHRLRITAGTAQGASADITLSAEAPDLWHWTVRPAESGPPPRTPFMEDFSPQRHPLTVSGTDSEVHASGPNLRIAISKEPWALRFLDREGREVWGENPEDVDGLGRPFALPLGFVRKGGRIVQTTVSLRLSPDEHLYGLGEKFTPLDKRQQRIVTWTVDALGSTTERSHKNIPFLLSTKGYGLLLDTGARVTWDLGMTSAQSCTVTVDEAGLDAWIIHGPTPGEILRRYADLTGHAPVPPRWSFGLWLSSGGTYRTEKSIRLLLDGIEAHDLPADVIHIDPWWMKWRRYCDFRWDAEAFPRAEELIRLIHARGLKLCLWEHPYISVESDLYDYGRRQGYFARRPDGEVYVVEYGLSLAPRPDGIVREAGPGDSWNAPVAIIDLTNPDACRWFQDLHRPVFRLGADVFKTDFGEDIPADAVFHNGETGATMHNLYPLLYNRAVFEVTREEKGHGIVWGRAGTAGSQRYPVCWSGDPAADFASLACTIRGGLSAGFSGIPFWSSDIGGYRGKPSPELYVRWAQFGLFCSHSRMHGDSPREPWIFGERALRIVRDFVRLRYQLFPYFYSCAHEARRTGMPVLRAMPLAFPGDPNAADKDLQFMAGPQLLVAPVYEPTGKRMVYLPEGNWVDFWNGRTYSGPRSISVEAPLEIIPLFVRAGTILPMMQPANRIPAATIDPLVIRFYAGAPGEYTLYEDKGPTRFAVTEEGGSGVFGWDGQVTRSLLLEIHRPAAEEGAAGSAFTVTRIRTELSSSGSVRFGGRPQ